MKQAKLPNLRDSCIYNKINKINLNQLRYYQSFIFAPLRTLGGANFHQGISTPLIKQKLTETSRQELSSPMIKGILIKSHCFVHIFQNVTNTNPDQYSRQIIRPNSHVQPNAQSYQLAPYFEHIFNYEVGCHLYAFVYIGIKMQQNKKRRCDNPCQEHRFKINGYDQPNGTSLDVRVEFCPKYHRPPKPSQTTFPSFNDDKKYFTSGFVLRIDQKALIKNQHQILHQHNKHVKDSTQKTGKLIFPKPRKRHNICGVCKVQFSNYFKHIISEQHKSNLTNNDYSKQIVQIQKNFQELHPVNAPEYPIQIIKVSKNQETSELQTDKVKQDYQQKVDYSLGNIHQQIEAFIISSDDQKQSVESKVQNHQKQPSTSSRSDSPSKEKVQQKDHQNDSDSVQIISVKKPKQSTPQKSKKKKSQKSKKSKQKKHKKKKSVRSSSSSSEDSANQANQKKRGSIGKKGPDLMPQVKRPLFKKKQTPTTQSKPVQVLIQKSQIQNPKLDDEMQKILNNIVGGIKSCPPAQPRRKYQKGIDSSDIKSSVIGGNPLDTTNISSSKSVLSNIKDSIVSDKNQQSSLKPTQPSKNTNAIKSNLPLPNSTKPNSILQKLKQSTFKQKYKISLSTKKHINQNMKVSNTKVEKYIDLDSEEIVQTICEQNDKKKIELQLIMRYEEKKLAKPTVENAHTAPPGKIDEVQGQNYITE